MRRRTLLEAALGLALLPQFAKAQSLLDQGRNLLNQGGVAIPGTGGGKGAGLSVADIAQGLKDALAKGAEKTVARLGRADGFLGDSAVHIPLPDTLRQVQSALRSVGAAGLADDLETRMNRAAEQAVPRARDLFASAIRAMTVADARAILDGPADAATQYLRRTTGPQLGTQIRPLIETALQQAGAVRAYDALVGRAAQIPGLPDAKGSIVDWTRDKGLDGIFHYIAHEEADIRANPAARTTELLKKVFG
jgi:hypothetical protein